MKKFSSRDVVRFPYLLNLMRLVFREAIQHMERVMFDEGDSQSKIINDLLEFFNCGSVFEYCQ